MHTLLLLSHDVKLVEVLRTGVLSGQVVVKDFALDAKLLAQLVDGCAAAVVLDLPTVATAPGRFAELCSAIKKACLSAKIGLVASAALHVDEAMTAWAERMGASVVVPQVSAARWASTGGRLMSALLGEGNSQAPDVAHVVRDSATADFWDRDTQTQLIAAAESAHVDLSALAQSMSAGGEGDAGALAIADHSYHLSVYSECFVASDAVTWLAKQLDVPRQLAVAKGQALQAAGLIYHVAREQVFGDDNLFFRMAKLPARWDMDSFYALIRRPSGFRIADRPYLGEVYSNCFVGSEAVAWMIDHGFTMNEALSVGQRLLDASLIHHVVNEHSFKDKELYYRFYRTQS